MKKFSFLLVLSLLCTIQATAERVSEQQAREVVQQFFAPDRGLMKSGASGNQSLQLAHSSSSYYIFNRGEGNGFVVAAADDRFSNPVLGFSDEGAFDAATMPDNVRYWLGEYDRTLAHAEAMGFVPEAQTTSVMQKAVRATRADIAPRVTARWGQDAPFNAETPNNYPTGCVATAAAQILYYKQFPTTYNYGAMQDYYSKTGSTAPEVARLMYDLGTAFYMNYGPSESATSNINAVRGLIDNFGFDKGAILLQRSFYDDKEWVEMLYNELSTNGPLFYAGKHGSGGHAFVCDGYKNENGADYFYFNWGWYGSYNGYFLLNALNPMGSGTGGGSGTYNNDQEALFYLKPAETGSQYAKLLYNTTANFAISNTSQTHSSTATFTGKFVNYSLIDQSFTLGLQVIDSNNQVTWIEGSNTGTMPSYGFSTDAFTVNLSGFPQTDGDYSVFPAYKDENNEWQVIHTWNLPSTTGRYIPYLNAKVSGSNITFSTPALDAEIRPTTTPSYREVLAREEVIASYRIANNTKTTWSKEFAVSILNPSNDKPLNGYTFGTQTITLAPGESRDIEVILTMPNITTASNDIHKYNAFIDGEEYLPLYRQYLKINPNTATVNYTVQFGTTMNGTFKIKNGTSEITSGTKVSENTTLTVEVTPAEGFVLDKIYVNGTALSGTTFTVTKTTNVEVTFKARPEGYVEPTGTKASGESYLVNAQTTNATANINKNWSSNPDGVYQLVDQTITVTRGSSFTLNLNACKAGEASSSIAYQDLRYTQAYIYTDWNQDYAFVQDGDVIGVHSPGAGSNPNNVLANYHTVLEISKQFTVPADAQLGETRIRVIYQSAWVDLNDGANSTNIDGGIVYDFKVNVVGTAPQYALTINPTTTTTDHGTFVVQNADGATVNNGSMITAGSTLTVVPTPAEGYVVNKVVVNGVGQDALTFVVNGATTVTVTFKEATGVDPYDSSAYCKPSYNTAIRDGRSLNSLTLSDGANSVTINSFSNTAVYNEKTTVVLNTEAGETISINANYDGSWIHGYMFVDYNNDGQFADANPTEGYFNFNVGSNGVPAADSELVSYSYFGPNDGYNGQKVTSGFDSSGQAYSGGDNAARAGSPKDRMPSFTIPANLKAGDYRVRFNVNWNSIDPCCEAYAIGDTPTQNRFDNVNGAYVVDFILHVTASAPVVNHYTITLAETSNGSLKVMNGTTEITNGQEVEEGTTLTVEATPAEGYELESITVNGVALTAGTQGYTFDVTQNAIVAATFTRSVVYHTVMVTTQGGSATSPIDYTIILDGREADLSAVPEGSTLTLMLNVPSGKEAVVKWGDVTLEANTAGAYEFVVDGNKTLSITLKNKVVYCTVTITQPENGTIVVKANGDAIESGTSLAKGTNLTIEATANAGYELGSITLDDYPISTTSPLTYQLSSNANISATFTEISYTVTVDAPDDLLYELSYYTGEGEDDYVVIESGDKVPAGKELWVVLYETSDTYTATVTWNGASVERWAESYVYHTYTFVVNESGTLQLSVDAPTCTVNVVNNASVTYFIANNMVNVEDLTCIAPNTKLTLMISGQVPEGHNLVVTWGSEELIGVDNGFFIGYDFIVNESNTLTIDAVSTVGVETVLSDQVRVFSTQGKLHLEAAKATASILTTNGVMLCAPFEFEGKTSVELPQGLYIVRIGEKAQLVNVK